MQNVVTYASCQSPIEPNALHFVSDAELLFRTRELARHETEFTIITIQHLDEIERRGLYDRRGYPSLFEYAVRELHYSKGSTWRRIMVMKLCRTVPGIADKLRSGELNLTTASQLQNAIEKRARKAARERARESVSVPPAGAVNGAAGEPVSGEVQPARTRAAGVAGVEAAASGAVWAAVGEAATQVAAGESAAGESAAGESAAGESAAGESAAAVPLPTGTAAAGVTPAAAPLAPAQAETVGVGSAAAVPAEPATGPRETADARAAGNAEVAAPPASASAAASPTAASPTAGAARESAALPPVAVPPPAWTLDQTVDLVNLVANKSARETEKLLAELEPELALPRERQRALGGGRYEVRVVLDQSSVDTIAKLKGLLSHVNPGFTTGQLLAYLLQQAERKYDPLRKRGRAKRGAAAPARHAETCEQHPAVSTERRATGSALGAGSKAGSSTCPIGALGEGMPATKAARGSIAAGAVAALAPALGSAAAALPASAPAAAGLAAARVRAPGSAATGPGGALTGGSAQNQRAPTVPGRRADRTSQHAAGLADAGVPAPAPPTAGPSGALTGGSAQNQQAPAVPGRGADQTSQDAAGSADAGVPASAPHAAGSSGALAGGSAQNQLAPAVPDHRADRTPQRAAGLADAGFPASAPHAAGSSGALAGGSAQNQRAPAVPGHRADRTPQDAAGLADAGFPASAPHAAGFSGELATGSAQNQLAQRAGNVRSRTDTEAHRGVRARLPEGGSAGRPPATESSRARRSRRHIPAAVRRAVWRRDGGTCCYQDPLTGVTCGSTHLVQIDHIVPVAQGGSDDIANLRLLCAVHNRRRDPRCASYRSAAAAAGGRSR